MFVGFFEGGGIFQIPFLPPDGSGKDRTGPLLLPVAKGDEKGDPDAEVGVDLLGLVPGNVDAQLAHRFDRYRVERRGFAACAFTSKRSAAKSRKKASAICVRQEFPEQRKSTLGLIIGLAPICNR